MDESQENKSNVWMWVIVVFVTVMVVLLLWCLVPSYLTAPYTKISEKGALGDTYGTVNALFTALAFGGLIITILLQRQELKLQRDELRLQRMEMQGQREQLQIQSATFEQQRFETTFFELLRVHNDIISSFYTVDSGRYVHGRECLRIKVNRLLAIYQKDQRNVHELMSNLNDNGVPRLEQFFKQLYHIVKFIDDSEISRKSHYMGLLHSQLDYNELILLAYNGLGSNAKDFKRLIEKYGLLENLPQNMLLDERHANRYSGSAFSGTGNGHES